MIIPWKVIFLLHQLTWSTYKKTSDVLLSPLTYYGSLVDLARNKELTAPWTFNLKTGSTVNIRHFMSSYIFREIFIDECMMKHCSPSLPTFPTSLRSVVTRGFLHYVRRHCTQRHTFIVSNQKRKTTRRLSH